MYTVLGKAKTAGTAEIDIGQVMYIVLGKPNTAGTAEIGHAVTARHKTNDVYIGHCTW